MRRAGGVAVGRLREFERHIGRPASREAYGRDGRVWPRLQHMGRDLDSSRAKQRMAAPGDARIGIVHAGDDARDATGGDRVNAGRRRTMMEQGSSVA